VASSTCAVQQRFARIRSNIQPRRTRTFYFNINAIARAMYMRSARLSENFKTVKVMSSVSGEKTKTEKLHRGARRRTRPRPYGVPVENHDRVQNKHATTTSDGVSGTFHV